MENVKLLVLKSSAGSGKTYALVRQYLLLALNSPKISWYRHILAITFTNAAAAEMKERVLKSLRGLAGGPNHSDYKAGLASDLMAETGLSHHELSEKAAEVFSHMLHHYGMISISTIDSFVHKLIRSFTRELQLSGDFGLSTDSKLFNQEVVDRCISRIGEDETLTTYLTQFALDNLENEQDWNVRKQLEDFARLLQDEKSITRMQSMSHLELKDFSDARQWIQASRAAFSAQVKKLASEGLDLIEKHQIPFQHFSSSYLPNFFTKNSKGDFFAMNKTLQKSILEGRLYPQKLKGSDASAIDSITPQLSKIAKELDDLVSGEKMRIYKIQEKVLKGINATGLLRTFFEIGNELRKDKNLLLVSDFQPMISEIVRDNDAPFIYEKTGERYHHILFDEFQDTSLFQWTNFIPLVQNSLAEGFDNFIVGDGKQAIYRWRNGNVEQFVNLPDLPVDDVATKEMFKAVYSEQILDTNYRSRKAIVTFNNEMFEYLKSFAEHYKKVYDNLAQNIHVEGEGLVVVQTNIGANKDERIPATLELIYENILECFEDGFIGEDIAILTRRKEKEAGVIANFLSEKGLSVETSDSFLLSNSANIRVIILFLKVITTTLDQPSRLLLAETLCQLHDEKFESEDAIHTFSKGIKNQFQFDLENFLTKYFPKFNQLHFHSGSITEYIHQIVWCFELNQDEYIETLLNCAHSQQSGENSSPSAFLEWWEDNKTKLFIKGIPDKNAVKIMTVHASKGLQFPVVIYPRFFSDSNSTDLWINTSADISPLPQALVNQSRGKNDLEIPEFEAELQLNALDELNVAYVACTRAEQRMYMIIESKNESAGEKLESRNLNERILEFIQQKPSGFKSEQWETGTSEPAPLKKSINTKKHMEFKIPEPKPFKYDASITHSRSSWKENSAKRNGELVHQILSVISSNDDAKSLRNKISLINEIHPDEVEYFVEYTQQVLRAEGFRNWFLPEIKTKSETEILHSSGSILRPDRVVYFTDRIEVVDFKTGSKRAGYHDQVKTYVEAIRTLETLPVRGFIAYTDAVEVVEVEV